jgi:GNAT superfamily N-acetyltransferase
MSITLAPVDDQHLPALQALVNAHLDAAIPGWALTRRWLQEHLRHNPEQVVIDPWVQARQTLAAWDQDRLVAAAHLLRYGSGPAVGPDYQDTGDLAWCVFWPGSLDAGLRLLDAAQEQMAGWGVRRVSAWDAGLPIGLTGGVPDAWPHIAEALAAAGYQCQGGRREATFGGWLAPIPAPGEPPLPGLSVERSLGRGQTRFTARLAGEAIGHCECAADLTRGGALPALRGWAELGELAVADGWRGRGVGGWLVRHAAAWLRLGGCDRVVLSVDAGDEAAGAGRFYQRLGWDALTRHRLGWARGTPEGG